MAEIVLDKVTKRFDDGTTAVREVDLQIADGEFVILVGPSGCGKSTLLNMIAGLEDITSGELVIGGQRVNEREPRERDIAMVFQSYALYPNMTVRENIAFPLRLAKVDKQAVTQRVDEAARLLELTELLDRRPANLSGGQRQRVAMGRAIVRKPKAFLMDEPLSNLDAKLRVQMRTVVARLQKKLGTTTVYVTHDQTEAMTLGDRVVVLRAGVVQQIGHPQELYDNPANIFVAGFIGSPAMNFMHVTLTGDTLRTPLGELPADPRWKGLPQDLVMGIRPEHLLDSNLAEPTGTGVAFEATAELAVLEHLPLVLVMQVDHEAVVVQLASQAIEDMAQLGTLNELGVVLVQLQRGIAGLAVEVAVHVGHGELAAAIVTGHDVLAGDGGDVGDRLDGFLRDGRRGGGDECNSEPVVAHGLSPICA